MKTDRQSLKHLLDQKMCTEAQHKWVYKLQGFNYRVEYKRGQENIAADNLSRNESALINAITEVHADWVQQFKEQMQQSSYY